jgi:8-oxo-dGTP pyrophosphatase MutT (NUDIX family)
MFGTVPLHTPFSRTMHKTEESIFSPSDVVAVGPWRCQDVECVASSSPVARTEQTTLEFVDTFWTSYRVLYPVAFDGPMVGLLWIESCTARKLRLRVKTTSFARYVATRSPSFASAHPKIERANPIGLTIMVVSADGQVAITKRSASLDQNPGKLYFIGGYIEPSSSGHLKGLVCKNAAREISEELGLAGSGVAVTGMAIDPEYCHPELFAICKVADRAPEIDKAWQNAQDKREASKLMFRPIMEMLSIHFDNQKEGVTWSFLAATYLLSQCWKQILPMLESY